MSSAAYSLRDLATRWSVSTRTLRRWIKQGQLRAFQLPGGVWRVHAEDVEAVEQGQPE